MRQFETKEELVEWIETMHLQNTNGRETGEEMFRLGIEATIEELTECNLLSIPDIVHQREQLVCGHCYGTGKDHGDEIAETDCPSCNYAPNT
jgi:rubrerythrin